MTDAEAACPVCGAVAWVEIGARVHCERCGLQVAFVEVGASEAEVDEDWQARYERELAEFACEQAEAVASAAFPVYGLAEGEPQIGGCTTGEDGVEEVDLEYADGRLQIESGTRESWGRNRLRDWLTAAVSEHPDERAAAAKRSTSWPSTTAGSRCASTSA